MKFILYTTYITHIFFYHNIDKITSDLNLFPTNWLDWQKAIIYKPKNFACLELMFHKL